MNKTIVSIIKPVVIVFAMMACEKPMKVDSSNKSNNPQPVVISGEIVDWLDTTRNNTIRLYIHDAGTSSTLTHCSQIDKTGCFLFQFERFMPQDVVIEYGSNFKVLVHPNDSLHLKFLASNDPITLLKTLKFSGHASIDNSILAQYQLDYYSKFIQKLNNYDFEEINTYKSFHDTLHLQMKGYLSGFFEIYKPTKEIEQWIFWDLEVDRAISLLEFTRRHKIKNKLPQTWMAAEGYYEFLDTPLSMDKSALTNSKAARWFVNKFLFEYVYPKAIIEIESKSTMDKLLVAWRGIDASLLENIKIHTEKNRLLRQLCYCAFFNDELEKKIIENFEDNKEMIEQDITEPCLKYPLLANYEDAKVKIKQPLTLTDFKTSSIIDAEFDALLEDFVENKSHKLLYIDVWATWCSPCIDEMKKSKELHQQFTEKGVECVFVCIDSEKGKCEEILAELGLKGQFYFFDKKQSNLLREKFGVSGIPHYILINKAGVIIDSGSHLRPSGSIIMEKIKENI